MAPNYQVEATQGTGFPTYYVDIHAIPADLEEGEVLPALPHWFLSTLRDSAVKFPQILALATTNDDWGLKADIICYHEYEC